MPTKLERKLAEQVLLGNAARPALELFTAGLNSFVGARNRLRPLVEEAPPGRGRVVRSKLKRGATLILYVGTWSEQVKERFKAMDPDTGLTVVKKRTRERRKEAVIAELVNKAGARTPYSIVLQLATELADRCRGDVELVARVCGAIERARQRCFELGEEATRWL